MKYTITEIRQEETKLEFQLLPPLFLPFRCEPHVNVYYSYKPFNVDPFRIWAQTCSGSPVIVAHHFFVGFLNETGGNYNFNGANKLTVTVPAGQQVLYAEGDPYEAWKIYNDTIIAARGDAPYQPQEFWKGLEYCTWVDQKNEAYWNYPASTPYRSYKCLNEEYVYNFMRRIEKLGLPAGKLTIDDCWDDRGYENGNRYTMGNWDINRNTFPHMEQLIKDMTASGYYPGLWISPFIATPDSRIGMAHPELLGYFMYPNGDSRKRHFLKDDDCLEDYYRDIFTRYIGMGVKKFKCDLSYGPKNEMKLIMKRVYRIIKELDPTVEMEMHIPDIFVSRYGDTVRMNDVCFEDGPQWRDCTIEHYRVARMSTDRVINLDHLGTNSEEPFQELFMEHTRKLLSLKGGFPCVSFMPDRLAKYNCDEYVELIKNWKYEDANLL